MIVLVNGIGNIGTTISNILNDYKSELGITKIYALKNSKIQEWNSVEIELLISKGIEVCSTKNNPSYKQVSTLIDTVDYIFDCNTNSIGLKNKTWYESLPNLKGCSAQGSEKTFGIPFMSGINDDKIRGEKFAQIVSCNTHSLTSIISTFSNYNYNSISETDFVIVRRSEDIGNHQRLVTANVVSRHLNNQIGTHHAIDVKDLLATIDINPNVQSSDITTPSQLMHTVRFNIQFNKPINLSEIETQISNNPMLSITNKFDSNVIFELGRRYSPYGRLFSHAIVNQNNMLHDKESNRIKGWAFIPQEGNTIISSIHAYLLQTNNPNSENVIKSLVSNLINKNW